MNNENNFNEAKHLLYSDIKVGMEVIDNEGDRSIILDCSDIHNVEARFILGGKGYNSQLDGYGFLQIKASDN